MKTLIIVPAFNEQKTIAGVLLDLKKNGFNNILVVDDGSSDKTGEIAKHCGVQILRHILNRGLGSALGTGFEFALRNSFDIVVTFDADGQHNVKDLKQLMHPIQIGDADVVIGSRLIKNGNMPFDRKLINYLSNLITFIFYGVWTTDSQSGLRAFGTQPIRKIKIKTDRMEVSSEFFKEIKRNHLRFVEIPIKPVYTEYSLSKSQEGRGTLNAFYVGLKMLIRLFR